MTTIIDQIEKGEFRSKAPEFRSGDIVRVHTKVREGERERIQLFEGMVIQRKGSGVRATFTVRKVSFGVGVERIFPLHSPLVDKVEVVKTGKVNKARIYYIRKRSGKDSRLKERLAYGQELPTAAATSSVAESAPSMKAASKSESSPALSK